MSCDDGDDDARRDGGLYALYRQGTWHWTGLASEAQKCGERFANLPF